MLAHILGAPCLDDVMSYNSLTTLVYLQQEVAHHAARRAYSCVNVNETRRNVIARRLSGSVTKSVKDLSVADITCVIR